MNYCIASTNENISIKKTQIVQCLAIIMVIFQRIKRPLQRLLDHAKANIDVIDFRNPQKEVR